MCGLPGTQPQAACCCSLPDCCLKRLRPLLHLLPRTRVCWWPLTVHHTTGQVTNGHEWSGHHKTKQDRPGHHARTRQGQGHSKHGLTCSAAQARAATNAAASTSDDWELDPSEIAFHDKIASGAFGDLYRGVYCGQDVAIKILRNVQTNSQQFAEFQQVRSPALWPPDVFKESPIQALDLSAHHDLHIQHRDDMSALLAYRWPRLVCRR